MFRVVLKLSILVLPSLDFAFALLEERLHSFQLLLQRNIVAEAADLHKHVLDIRGEVANLILVSTKLLGEVVPFLNSALLFAKRDLELLDLLVFVNELSVKSLDFLADN